ncbi:LAGLIDADG family homing endonuclease [Candidatus Woesearchaeota archaeon]|nr:LAGLIDADG family homing endonuclease [Candidatus Woesearchaeota archaeon]
MGLPKSKLDPYIEEIKSLYINGLSTNEIKVHLFEKKDINISSVIIRRKLKKCGIKIRNNIEAIKLSKRKHLPTKEIINLYVNQGLSLRKIARLFLSNKATVHKILEENKIYVRNNRESNISIGYIKEKKKFALSLKEKAYLFGLVGGDLTPIRKSDYTLKLITHTTHPAFARLLKETFEKYGPFSNNLNKNNEFRCSAYLDLESFSFLLDSKKDEMPNWIDNKNLFDFLAGFIDSDGSIMIKKRDKNFGYYIRFYGENLNLLKEVKVSLEKSGYKSSMHKNHYKGEVRNYNRKEFRYNKDYYALEIYKKWQVLDILPRLPIRHEEKISKKDLIFSIEKRGLKSWLEIEEELINLKNKIKNEVNNRFI